MEQAVKQRIVGTVVLLALGLLAVPVLFNSSSEPSVSIERQIPPKPDTAIAPVAPVAPVSVPERSVSEQFASADLAPLPETAAVAAKSAVPAQPVTQAKAAPAAVEAQAATSALAAKAAAPSQMSPTQPQAGLQANGLPQGFVVQVGAFAAEANAEQLLQKLKAKGYQAYRSRSKSGAHAVLIGPHIDRQQAQRTAQNVKRDLGLDSMIKPFQP